MERCRWLVALSAGMHRCAASAASTASMHTRYFVRSVVCGVNQTQMCCSRESVSRGEGESCGFDRLSVSCLCWGFDRFRTAYTVGIPTVRNGQRAMRVMGRGGDACGCVSTVSLSRKNLRLSVSERRMTGDDLSITHELPDYVRSGGAQCIRIEIRIDKRTATAIDAAPRHGCRCGMRGGGPTSRAGPRRSTAFFTRPSCNFRRPRLTYSSLNGLHRLHQASHFCQLRLAALLPERHDRREPGPPCACPIFLPSELTSTAPACAC